MQYFVWLSYEVVDLGFVAGNNSAITTQRITELRGQQNSHPHRK